MAATKSQGKGFTMFIAGLTAATAGIAYFSSGSGKLALVVGLAALAASFGVFLKIKPLEGAVASKSQPFGLKLAGLVVVLLGWLVVLVGLHLTDSVGGRMITSFLGIAITLVGSLVLLPAAANKNAIWKA
jgi:hypothetical protein